MRWCRAIPKWSCESAITSVLQSITWGFPLAMKSKVTGLPIKPKPVNNVADVTRPMRRGIAPKTHGRFLVPVTAFAEAGGEKGAKSPK